MVSTHMGLVKKVDDHVGRLLQALEALGGLDDTLIVFTSDPGDLLGDHWLGAKEMFCEASAKVPLIVVAPRLSAADGGRVDSELIEAIDLLPTPVRHDGEDPLLEICALRRVQAAAVRSRRRSGGTARPGGRTESDPCAPADGGAHLPLARPLALPHWHGSGKAFGEKPRRSR